jgi:hypothetical protein
MTMPAKPAAHDYEASDRIGMIDVNARFILELGARKWRELFQYVAF